jgi:hypothetical protein
MSNGDNETDEGIADEELPEDLVPSEDNPLAEGLEPGETAGDLLEEGKPAEREGDAPDSDESAG